LSSGSITAIQHIDGYLFAGADAGGIYRSSDQGENWFQTSNGLPENVPIRCMHVYENRIFAGTGDGSVFISCDYGNNWINISDGLIGSPVLSLYTYGDFVFAGLNAGGVWRYPLSETEIICNCEPGDANGDGQINVSDAVYLIAYVFKGGPSPSPYPMCSGDADCGGSVNISDATYLINYIFKGGPEPCCP
jgi:hypothetical protein